MKLYTALIFLNFVAICGLHAETCSVFTKTKENEQVERLRNVIHKPNVLLASVETGTVLLEGQAFTIKAGGMGVVTQDHVNRLPLFLPEGSNVTFAFMGMKGTPKDGPKYTFSRVVRMGERQEKIDYYRYQHENGATLYFLHHPQFARLSLEEPYRDLGQDKELRSPRPEWENLYTYALYNLGIAELQKKLEANIYISNDFHTMLAHLYMDPQTTVGTSIIHNGGYRGIYYTDNYGDYYEHPRNYSDPRYPFGMPQGDYLANDELLRLLNLDFDTWMKTLEHSGQTILLKILQFISQNNLVGGLPVSQGYAEDLKKELKEIVFDTILHGVENGIDRYKVHASSHPKLQGTSTDKVTSLIKIPEVKSFFTQNNTFGEDLETAQGQKEVHLKKAQLKEKLQQEAGLEIDRSRPVIGVLSRFDDNQKGISKMIAIVEYGVQLGFQFVFGGIPTKGDTKGEEAARNLLRLSQKYPKQVKYYNTFVKDELGVLIQAGADFTLITSRFEPCGLTDLEAAALGTIPLARRTGGLGKVRHGLYYDWDDLNDHEGEVLALQNLLYQAHNLYQDQERFYAMRIGAMGEDFPWSVAFEKYFDNIHTAGLYKIIKAIEEDIAQGRMSLTMGTQLARYLLSPMGLMKNLEVDVEKAEKMRTHFLQTLAEKSALTPLEKGLLELSLD